MVSTSTVFFFFFFFIFMIFSCFASSMEARKLLRVQEMEKKMIPSEEEAETVTAAATVDVRLYLNALPKGKVPASTPSNKGHEQIIDEKLIARHLVAVDRILRSVPSPGVGH